MKNLEKCVARLIRALRTRSARSRGLNRQSAGETCLTPTVHMRVKRGVPCWRGVPWRGVPWRGVPCAGCRARGAPMSLPRSTKLQIWRLVFLTRVELWFGCCRARSPLSKKYFFTFELVRSGENERPECFCAILGSAPSQRDAFWWNFSSF